METLWFFSYGSKNRKSQKKDTIHNKNNKPKYAMPRNTIHMKCVGSNGEKLKHNERNKSRLDRNDKQRSLHSLLFNPIFI